MTLLTPTAEFAYVLVRPVGTFQDAAAAMAAAGCPDEECDRILAGMAAAGESMCTCYLPGDLLPFFRVQPAQGGGYLLLAGNRGLSVSTEEEAITLLDRIEFMTGERWTYLIDAAAPNALH